MKREDLETIKKLMLEYGFTAPDMTVTEFVEDILSTKETKSNTFDCIKCIHSGYICDLCKNGSQYEGETIIPIKRCLKEGDGMTEIIVKLFGWNDNLSEIAQEDFSMIQKSLSYGAAISIGMALAKLELLEKQGCKVRAESEEI